MIKVSLSHFCLNPPTSIFPHTLINPGRPTSPSKHTPVSPLSLFPLTVCVLLTDPPLPSPLILSSLASSAMSKPQTQRPKPPPSGRTNLASCIVATVFLIFVVIVSLIVYFTVFKPKDPKISVSAVQLPSFSIQNSTVTFTFSQYVAVRNPNRAAFRHYDSTLQLLYSGSQVGFMFIPAGSIEAGQTRYLAATFSVQSFPVSDPNRAVGVVQDPMMGSTFGDGLSGFRGGGATMEIESRMEMAGRVRVMHFFTHHAEAKSGCKVIISVSDGSVLGFHC